MKWQHFLDELKGLSDPYPGTGEDKDEVKAWMRLQGHDAEVVEAHGVSYSIDDLFETREGKRLDVSDAATEAEADAKVQKRVDAAVAELKAIHEPVKRHDINVGKDRVTLTTRTPDTWTTKEE